MKLTSRTEDLQAVAESEQGGWQASVGRFKIRVEDLLDVGEMGCLITFAGWLTLRSVLSTTTSQLGILCCLHLYQSHITGRTPWSSIWMIFLCTRAGM